MSGLLGHRGLLLRDEYSDPDRAFCSLLLTFQGANGSTTFTDLSPVGNSVSAVGAAEIQSNQLSLSAATDGLSVANHATAFAFGTADYTIEFLVANTVSASRTIYGYVSSAATVSAGRSSFSDVAYDIPGYGAGAAAFGVWTAGSTLRHFAVMRQSGTIRVLFAGTSYVNTSTGSASNHSLVSTYPILLGLNSISGDGWSAAIAGIRIYKGLAKYTLSGTTYTPPTVFVP